MSDGSRCNQNKRCCQVVREDLAVDCSAAPLAPAVAAAAFSWCNPVITVLRLPKTFFRVLGEAKSFCLPVCLVSTTVAIAADS